MPLFPLVQVWIDGEFAVKLFFVLSGFVLPLAYWNTPTIDTAISCIFRRYFRLAIPAVASTILCYLAWKLNLAHANPFIVQMRVLCSTYLPWQSGVQYACSASKRWVIRFHILLRKFSLAESSALDHGKRVLWLNDHFCHAACSIELQSKSDSRNGCCHCWVVFRQVFIADFATGFLLSLWLGRSTTSKSPTKNTK